MKETHRPVGCSYLPVWGVSKVACTDMMKLWSDVEGISFSNCYNSINPHSNEVPKSIIFDLRVWIVYTKNEAVSRGEFLQYIVWFSPQHSLQMVDSSFHSLRPGLRHTPHCRQTQCLSSAFSRRSGTGGGVLLVETPHRDVLKGV